MKRFLFTFLFGLMLVGCFSYAFSQPPSSQEGTATAAPESSTIFITALSKDGAKASPSSGDIEIKVDGKPVTVQETHAVVGTPLQYCLLFDASGSRHDRFKLQQSEAAELLSKVVKAGIDHGMLVDFNDGYYLDGEGTNPQKFVNFIATERPYGGTAFYDAVIASVSHMSQSSLGPGPRVMFILSDGKDNESKLSQEAAVSALLKAGVKVYVIGQNPIDSPYLMPDKSNRTLKQFAERTGGKAYFPEQQDVDKVIAEITAELSNIFAVTFTTSSQMRDGQLHKLEVKCNKKDVSIRAQDHYYAPKR